MRGVVTADALRPYAPGVWDPDAGPAELYYLPEDSPRPEMSLPVEHPEKVQQLKELFWEAAEEYKVLPCSRPCPPSSASCRRGTAAA